MLKENKPTRFSDPNKYAPKPLYEFADKTARIYGYQDFSLTSDSINLLPESTPMLQSKYRLIKDYLRPQFGKDKAPDLSQQKVLDIGGNGGFFSFWAALQGADQVTLIDMDTRYVDIVKAVSKRLGFDQVTAIEHQVDDWIDQSDIVLALALVHWLYSCTEIYGSLDQVIAKLATLTRNVLIVEWIEPSDSAIQFFHHIEWNEDIIQGPYTLDAFEQALAQHFAHFEVIGQVSSTRKLYAATVKSNLLELGGPMPLLDKENLLSSHFLTKINTIDYWSRVYKSADQSRIIKQSTLDLAEREFCFLSQLSGDYSPKASSFSREEGYSTVEMEYITGLHLTKAIPALQASFETIVQFFHSCLLLLEELQKHAITHRDISTDNIIIRNNKPVLLDFGWAESPGRLVTTPQVMGGGFRPGDNIFCDTYAIGKVLKKVNQDRYPQINQLIELMTQEHRSLRLTDVRLLQVLLNLVSKESLKLSNVEPNNSEEQENQITELANYLYKSNQHLNLIETELAIKQREVETKTGTIDAQAHSIGNLTRQLTLQETQATKIEQTSASWKEQAIQAEQTLVSWKNQAIQAEQTLASWKNQAIQAEQTLASWKEQANHNYQDLQALQSSRTVKIGRFLGKVAGSLIKK